MGISGGSIVSDCGRLEENAESVMGSWVQSITTNPVTHGIRCPSW